jgi:hypothetical protein
MWEGPHSCTCLQSRTVPGSWEKGGASINVSHNYYSALSDGTPQVTLETGVLMVPSRIVPHKLPSSGDRVALAPGCG